MTMRNVSNSWCVSGGASIFPFIQQQQHRRVSGEQNHDVQTKPDGVNPKLTSIIKDGELN